MKTMLKQKAIDLRKTGLSYSEILKEIHVSKSTLSLWIRSFPLSESQKERFRVQRKSIVKKAHYKSKQIRINRTNLIKKIARKEIKEIDYFNLLLIGAVLYWAEGAKQKEYEVSQGVCFANSDPLMIKLFLLWLKRSLQIPDNMITFDLYVHDTRKHPNAIQAICAYWSTLTGFPIEKFDKIYYKKNKISTNRKNINHTYFGLLRVKVKKSTDLNRKITGWIEGICNQCGVV